jgi:hypothetical protein
MPGKRVQFDDETLEAIRAVARNTGKSFQKTADEAFADFLRKHKPPVGLKASLKESVRERGKRKRPSGPSSAAPPLKQRPIYSLFCLGNRTTFISGEKAVSRENGKVGASWIHSNEPTRKRTRYL